jgi:hypothetical protein
MDMFSAKMPAAPKMPDSIRIPSPDDPDMIAARKKKMQDEFASRQGRSSTVLDSGGGSNSYSRTTLG